MPEQPTQPAESAQAEQLSFIGFVISLATTAAVHFGDVVNPVSGEKGAPDLVAAKQMIDILSLLEQKTKGNLTAEERSFLEQVLYDLRLRFVQVATAEQRSKP